MKVREPAKQSNLLTIPYGEPPLAPAPPSRARPLSAPHWRRCLSKDHPIGLGGNVKCECAGLAGRNNAHVLSQPRVLRPPLGARPQLGHHAVHSWPSQRKAGDRPFRRGRCSARETELWTCWAKTGAHGGGSGSQRHPGWVQASSALCRTRLIPTADNQPATRATGYSDCHSRHKSSRVVPVCQACFLRLLVLLRAS